MQMEKVNCPVCDCAEFRKLFSARDLLYGVVGEFSISKCCDCGMVMLNPRPAAEELNGLYPDDYEAYALVAGQSDTEEILRGQQGRRELVGRYCAHGRILDVGSGDGRFLLAMQRAGWEPHGCETSAKSADFQRRELGFDVRVGDVLSTGFDAGFFDVVTLWSVLEHVPDPVAVLVEAARVLKPRGIVVVGVPNFASLERVLFRSKWFSLHVPHHLFHFTPRTMEKVVERGGLEVERVLFSTMVTAVRWSLKLILTGSAEPAVGGCETAAAHQSTLSRARAKKILFDYVVVPALKTIDAFHLGGTTNYILRKP